MTRLISFLARMMLAGLMFFCSGCTAQTLERTGGAINSISPTSRATVQSNKNTPVPTSTNTPIPTTTVSEKWDDSRSDLKIKNDDGLVDDFQWYTFIEKVTDDTFVFGSNSVVWKAKLNSHERKIAYISSLPSNFAIHAFCVSFDGRYLAMLEDSGYGDIGIYDLSQNERIRSIWLKDGRGLSEGYGQDIEWTNNGEILVGKSYTFTETPDKPSELFMVFPKTGIQERILTLPPGMFWSIEQSPVDNLVAVSLYSGDLFIVDIEAKNIVWQSPPEISNTSNIWFVRWSQDGQKLVAHRANKEGDHIFIWDKNTGMGDVKVLPRHYVSISQVLWSKKGDEIILVASNYGVTQIITYSFDLSKETSFLEWESGDNATAAEISIDPDQLYIVWTGKNPGLSLIERQTGKEITRIP